MSEPGTCPTALGVKVLLVLAGLVVLFGLGMLTGEPDSTAGFVVFTCGLALIPIAFLAQGVYTEGWRSRDRRLK